MKRVFDRFRASMYRIHEDFHLGCLALVFVDQQPFLEDIVLPLALTKKSLPAAWLNDLRADQLDEYAGALVRHFLNDMVLAYERYATTMLLSHESAGVLTEPAVKGNRRLTPGRFEKLRGVYSQTDRDFVVQLRYLRNTVVHYNGLYNTSN
ncbi:MAG: hypothetical protein ACOY3Y_14125 [Acidobacteriota bacterium]